jgi:hypothetical protein
MYIDHMEDQYYRIEFFGDDIRRKIALISWCLVPLCGAFWAVVPFRGQSHLAEESLR